MNCDECKEQVLELLERERSEPEAVREVLERCPDCLAVFEELKSALDLASELPLEEPSAAVDQAVMRTAAAHANRVVSPGPWRFRPIPWAAAAVALLAVSVGVWSIPDRDAPEQTIAEEQALEPSVATDADQAVAEAAERGELAMLDEATTAKPAPSSAPAARRAKKSAPPATSNRTRVATGGEASRGADAAVAGSVSADTAFEARQLEAASMAEVESEPAPARQEERARDAECDERAAALDSDEREPTGEESLAVGRCFREVENYAEARRWFERASEDPKTRAAARRALRSLRKD